LRVSLALTAHRVPIERLIGKSRFSLYRVTADEGGKRAFSGLDFDAWRSRSKELLADCPYILKADISRFFYTIYTHSIPWAVIGKEQVKNWLSKRTTRSRIDSHWSGRLDAALQGCQARETFGIPVGPDTSRIIAELILCGLEKRNRFASSVANRPGLRLLDDFLIGFDTQIEAEKALTALRHSLWEYNLQLNDQKTQAIASRLEYQDPWRLEIELSRISATAPDIQRRQIRYALEQALLLCDRTGTDAPASWMCHRLKRINSKSKNFAIALDAMLRLGRDFPYCLSTASAFLINNQSTLQTTEQRSRIKAWIKSILKEHLRNGHHFELSWALLVAAAFNISLDASDLPIHEELRSPVIFCLLALLHERKLLGITLQQLGWRSHFRSHGITSENWLPLYEAVRRGWTKDRKIVQELQSVPLFADMLRKDVTFLEDRALNPRQIDLQRRTFKVGSASLVGTANSKRRRSEPAERVEEEGTFDYD
jgi:hypothetical protein